MRYLILAIMVLSACASTVEAKNPRVSYATHMNQRVGELMRVKFSHIFFVSRENDSVNVFVRIEDFLNGDRWVKLTKSNRDDGYTVFEMEGATTFIKWFKIPDNEKKPIIIIGEDNKKRFEMGAVVECCNYTGDNNLGSGTLYRASFVARYTPANN